MGCDEYSLFNPPGDEWDLEPELAIDKRIDAGEIETMRDRWEFGHVMLGRIPEGGTNLPDGYLDALVAATEKSRTELKYRAQFARENPTDADLANALAKYPSWFSWCNRGQADDDGPGAHVGNNSGDNEWYTPPEYIEAATRVMGGIDLDPASNAEANDIVGATTFYTPADDGLAQPWRGRLWMNPPYSQPDIDKFCTRMADQYATGNVSAACVLVNNATETNWFQNVAAAASAICFPLHRVRFWHPTKVAVPLQGQAVLYLGSASPDFTREFSSFGFIMAVL